MRLTTAQSDRAAGVLLGQACGDALGVPYEFARPPGDSELAEMKGGGLGDFAPGEWSDDTSMAVAVADGLGEDLDAVAGGFLRWYDAGPADIGIQTRAVLSATRRRLDQGESGPARVMAEEAASYSASHSRSAGNGALMRTSPVALAHLDDRTACAEAARNVALLTHGDPLAGDSCVLWSEAIRLAVLEGRIDVHSGLDLLPDSRRAQWQLWLDEATAGPASRFNPNGFTVSALQAAMAAITSTSVPVEDAAQGSFACAHLQDALHAAIRIGNDTDTVAAIAGGLVGARWGASAVPWRWRRAVHGWPGRDGRDLVSAAFLLTQGGAVDSKGWPTVEDVPYTERASVEVVPHPADPGVLLGTHRTTEHDATAVVSMCRVGRTQSCFKDAKVIVESRLMDNEDPAANPNLAFALYDAADAVRGLRAEGHTVLLQCVAAQQRTPSVAVAYSRLLGGSAETARKDVLAALPSARGWGVVWDAAAVGPGVRDSSATPAGRADSSGASRPSHDRTGFVQGRWSASDAVAESKTGGHSMKIDLHAHSARSDGTDSPEELVEAAFAAGLDVVAITDHDTTTGWAEATEAAQRVGLILVRGIELSTDNQGQSQHLLAYEVDPRHPALVERLEQGARSRRERVPRILAKLRKSRAPVSDKDVRDATGEGTTGRPHIADALVRARHVQTRKEAFDRYLAEGKPAYVPRDKLTIEEAILLVASAGGVSVIAHPRGRGAVISQDRFAALKELGLVGIEVDHEEHDSSTREELRKIASALGLIVTGASDYHGEGKKGHPLGCNTTAPEAFAALLGDRVLAGTRRG